MPNEPQGEGKKTRRKRRRRTAKPQAAVMNRLQVKPNFCLHCGMPIPKEIRV